MDNTRHAVRAASAQTPQLPASAEVLGVEQRRPTVTTDAIKHRATAGHAKLIVGSQVRGVSATPGPLRKHGVHG